MHVVKFVEVGRGRGKKRNVIFCTKYMYMHVHVFTNIVYNASSTALPSSYHSTVDFFYAIFYESKVE